MSKDDVDIRVQAFPKEPHQKDIIAISPVQIGQTGSVGVERASFVTGGTDHFVVSKAGRAGLMMTIATNKKMSFKKRRMNTLSIAL